MVRNIEQDQEFWNVQGEAAAMLEKLGIEDPSVMPDTLSGGQRKRAALAAALLTPSDLLILDEPTNHLDHEMIEWLQNQLESYRGALVMVTHDRYFLDEVTTTIWEIDRAGVYSYPGNYEKYLQTIMRSTCRPSRRGWTSRWQRSARWRSSTSRIWPG